MKVVRTYGLLFLSLLLSLPTLCLSQQYRQRDQEEIAYQAQLTLNMYNDLLNVISYADLATEAEIKKLIRNSYTNSRSQIFYSGNAIIEDNIKPSNLVSQHEQDKTIEEYLQYFDLAYQKSDQATIEFSNFQVSNLKQGRYLYIKVKYTSQFKGKHKEDPAPYKAVDRLAELRVEKRNNEWKTFITSIVYYQPDKPISSGKDDVVLAGAESGRGTFSDLKAQVNTGKGGASQQQNRSEKFSEQKKEQDSVFNYHMEVGKAALAAEELAEAFAAFSEAEKVYPFHQDLQLNLRELAKAQNRKISSVENSFDYVKLNADKAYAARDYTKAKSLYSEALRLRPEEENLKAVIKKLEIIIQKIALLESKYAVGEYQAAVKEYTQAIKEDRNNADYYFGRGKSFEKLNAVKEAFKDYSKAIELDGNFVQALSRRAQLYVKAGQYPEAVADYTLILSNPSYAADFYPERARVKKIMGDLNGAIDDFDAAIQEKPEEAGNYFEKGLVLLSQKRMKEAIGSFSEAIRRDPQHLKSLYQRGMGYVAQGDLQAASADFERAREVGLEDAQLAEINKLTLRYYAIAEGAMVEEKYSRALENFTNALLISPAFGRAWLRKGDVYSILGEYENAIANYDKAVSHDPVSLAYFKRGVAYQQMKDIQTAVSDFRQFVPIGRELMARTKKPAKVKKAAASLETNFVEERAEVAYALGYAQLMTQELVDALENLNMAIHIRKFFPKAYFARGAAFYALEDYKRAVKNMEESIRMGLSEPLVFYSLGKAYEARGQVQDAVYSYSHAIKLDPQYEAAYKERAISYKTLNRYESALDDIKKALSLNEGLKDDVALITQKGLLELHLNKPQEANQSFNRALRLDEANAWALYGKACALAQENKLEESLDLYRKAFQTRQIEWAAIKNDPLINPVSKQKTFEKLVKTYLN